MNIRRRIIWLAAGAGIATAYYNDKLNWLTLIAILIVAVIGIHTLGGPDAPTIEVPKDPEDEPKLKLPQGKHLITTDGVKQVRNLLMKHHEMKRLDKGYCESGMARQTVALIAHLNVYLNKH